MVSGVTTHGMIEKSKTIGWLSSRLRSLGHRVVEVDSQSSMGDDFVIVMKVILHPLDKGNIEAALSKEEIDCGFAAARLSSVYPEDEKHLRLHNRVIDKRTLCYSVSEKAPMEAEEASIKPKARRKAKPSIESS